MTENEARTVAKIALTADGGCISCAGELLRHLALEFPDHRDLFVRVMQENSWYGKRITFADAEDRVLGEN